MRVFGLACALLVALVVGYGTARVFFRAAYDVELPNPVALLKPETKVIGGRTFVRDPDSPSGWSEIVR